MASTKRPKMIARADALRTGSRESVVISGTCQVGERPAETVLVTDLSARGCRLQGDSVGVTKSEPVQLWFADAGPITAKLRWVKQGSLGLAFEVALDQKLLEKLFAHPFEPAPDNVVPLKRRFEA